MTTKDQTRLEKMHLFPRVAGGPAWTNLHADQHRQPWRFDLPGMDLSGENMCGADLREANLCGAHLRHAALTGMTLGMDELGGAYLTDATFDDATTWPDGFDYRAAIQ